MMVLKSFLLIILKFIFLYQINKSKKIAAKKHLNQIVIGGGIEI